MRIVKKYLTCSECGSDAIEIKAWATWLPHKQKFIYDFDTECYCSDCDDHNGYNQTEDVIELTIDVL